MNWSELWNSIMNTQPGLADIALRLFCAMLVGLVIGTEREYTHRPAGMRTHILVALGACAVSITGELLFNKYNAVGAFPDPARLSAQVVTGVGFLGAGTIMREGFSVKGLTTAASVWAVACLGIAAGFGYYALALFGMVFIFVTLTLFEWLQDKLVKNHGDKLEFTLETSDISASLSLINEMAQVEQGRIKGFSVKNGGNGHFITFEAQFSGRHKKLHRQKFEYALSIAEETVSLHSNDEVKQKEKV